MTTPYKVVVYLNGVRFYPTAVSYSAQSGGHSSFAVQVPGVPEWDILPPRSHCAVFYADPVSNSYRLLTEGEYIGYQKGKEAAGSRYRSLLFRSTHAVWEGVQYAGMVGLQTGKDAIQEAQLLSASGYEIRTASPDNGRVTDFDLARSDLLAFVQQFANNSLFSAFLPNFIHAVMQQTPVDAFYHAARKMQKKVFSLADNEISNVITSNLFIALIRDSWAPQNLGPSTSLETIISAFENVGMYTHTPIPAPPMMRLVQDNVEEDIIAETMFIPHLYTVVPPACNVVFRDQVSSLSGSRNYMQEPTRVITQLQAPAELGGGLPFFYMSNDVERSANISAILAADSDTNNPANQTNSGAAAGTIAIHDLLTQEEMHRGVIPAVVNLPIQCLVPVSPDATEAEKEEAKDKFELYMQSACRHFYEISRSASRSCTVQCVFLPYVVPGFPCLIEDASGSFFGFVQSVAHTLSATSVPQTSLVITHMREAYIIEGRLRNAFNPTWLNAKFLPENINDTYSKIFGVNAAQTGFVTAKGTLKHAAMVPTIPVVPTGSNNKLNAAQQVNMDELAAEVIPVPRYSADGSFLGISGNTVADKIRSSPNPHLAAYQFQYRAGTTLSQFARFHNLNVRGDDGTTGGSISSNIDYVFSREPLPADLAPDGVQGDPLFGTPQRMVFVGRKGTDNKDNPYGVYELDTVDGKSITLVRQRTARTVAAAIARRITEG